MEIRPAVSEDVRAVAWLSCLLWPHHTLLEMEEETQTMLSDPSQAVFLVIEDGTAVGFAHVSLRSDYVEGSTHSPTAYLEGIYVMEAYRGHGFAGELLHACENWGREKNCFQFASDCSISNSSSIIFHLKHQFVESNRIVCFIKEL